MADAKMVMKMTIDGTGRKHSSWTEAHYRVGSANLALIAPDAVKLANARVGLFGRNTRLIEIRLSVVGNPRLSQLILPGSSPGGNATLQGDVNAVMGGSPTSSTQQADLANVSFRARMSAADGRAKNLYLAGVPDAVMRTGDAGPDLTAFPGFQGRYTDYMNILKGAGVGNTAIWGFRSRTDTVKVPVIHWDTLQAAPFYAVAWVLTADAPAVAQSGKIQVRGVRPSIKGLPKINKTWIVWSKTVDAGTGLTGFALRGALGLPLDVLSNYGFLQTIAYEQINYADCQIGGQSTRKRGASADKSVGASSRR